MGARGRRDLKGSKMVLIRFRAPAMRADIYYNMMSTENFQDRTQGVLC